ncbi:glutamate--tRNA ligase [Candidatus Uhrbacteria bacterium]|nr:glutamate--tRNA ligase [Candidatus Uhrbacteria bacterium]
MNIPPLVRTRYAPSPTGELHLGGLRTALYSFLWARHHGAAGQFYVRIEDTDRERLVPGSADRMLALLATFGLRWDDGPYVQSERLSLYRGVAETLLAGGHAYRCDCSADRLTALRTAQAEAKQPTGYDRHCRNRTDVDPQQPHVVRFRTPESGTVTVTDMIYDPMTVDCATLDDFVLLKSDGFPTYHLAHVVDDHDMGTTHVTRGPEWLPSLPQHVLLFRALGWEPPTYAHLPLLCNAQHKKLSKRDGDVSVAAFLPWCLPEALLNFVALLGWNPSADRELYTLEELIATFDLAKVNRSPAVVDFTKLEWMNSEYLKRLTPTELLTRVARATGYMMRDAEKNTWTLRDDPQRHVDQEFLERVMTLEQPRLHRLDAIPLWYFAPYQRTAPLSWKTTDPATTIARLTAVVEYLERLEVWPPSPQDLEAQMKPWIIEHGWGIGEVLWPMRVALSGQTASPSPFELAWCFGREETLAHLRNAIMHADVS